MGITGRKKTAMRRTNAKKRGGAKIDVVSFFSGCGGLDLGFMGGFEYRDMVYAEMPFRIRLAVDLNQKALETYKQNVGVHVRAADLAKENVASMPSAQVLLGGFPCQEFSRCGPRKGLESERGGLYKAMLRYARHHKPALVIAENVADLLFINEGWDFSVIRKNFSRIGYRCVWWKINAADFGVPQNRHRVIIIFVRNDLDRDPDIPEAEFSDKRRTAEWAIDDLKSIEDESVPNQSQFFLAAPAANGHGQGDEITKRNEPGYTVRANAKSRVQYHYELPRRLTVRECARLQTFPDEFRFPKSSTEAVLQIGNAVPPVLAHAVAVSVAKYFEEIQRTKARESM